MPKALKILAVHRVGGHEAGGAWTDRWRAAIVESLGRAAPETRAGIEFVAYDDVFEAERFTALGTLDAVGKLLGSGLRGIPDRIRWTASMVVQWIEDDKLRARARDRRRPERRALLVGINDYPTPEARLEGRVNEVFLMSAALQERGFEPEGIRTVLDPRARARRLRDMGYDQRPDMVGPALVTDQPIWLGQK